MKEDTACTWRPGAWEGLTRWVLFYGVVAFVLTLELWWPGRSLFRWDTMFYNWPFDLEARSQVLSGHWPFWTSSFCLGTPLLENINAGVLYPLRLFTYLLPLPFGYHLFLFAHVWLALLGMHLLLAQGLRLPWVPTVCGALAYAASGYARGMWDTHNFVALPWIPLGLAALLAARHGRSVLAVTGVALCWALLVMAGDLQAAVLWVPVAFLLALVFPARSKLITVLGIGIMVGLLLSAIQWWPTWLASHESYRSGGLPLEEAVERSFHPARLLELATPYAFGSRENWMGEALAGEGATRVFPWSTSMHLGLLALLALFFVRARQGRAVGWACWVAGGSLLLSFGRFLPGYHLWQQVPLIASFRYPEKYLLWTTLALAVLVAYGVRGLLARRRAPRFQMSCYRRLLPWTILLVLAGMAAHLLASRISTLEGEPDLVWSVSRALSTAVVVILTWWFFTSRTRWRASGLVFLFMVDLLLAWNVERPTSSRLEPLQPPAVAEVIRSSSHPRGRLLVDRAVETTPLPDSFQTFRLTEKEASAYKERLAFNSPRLWGLNTAEGFSPIESKLMREKREREAAPEGESVAEVASLVSFIREGAVQWLLTTEARAQELHQAGWPVQLAEAWGKTVLVHMGDAKEAVLVGGEEDRVERVRRARPGQLSVDLVPGPAATLRIAETYAKGWQAKDHLGKPLETFAVQEAFLGVAVPDGVRQVRLSYTPSGWTWGKVASSVGLLLLGLLGLQLVGVSRVGSWVRRPACIVLVASVLYVVIGVSARNQWSCTFDEGFHLARGMARVASGDSRMSTMHPPLHNMASGYFATLAHGDRLLLPNAVGWQNEHLYLFATETALVNKEVYPDLVQAGRWGTVLFGLLLLGSGTWWAFRAAGPLAGWLAGVGLAMSPTVLAHGHLVTTDVAVTAWVVAGSFALWMFVREKRSLALLGASLCFALAAVSKFTGLVWLGAYVLLVLPLLAWTSKRPALLGWIPVTLVLFVGLVVAVYGTSPQQVRAPAGHPLEGWEVPAGRYLEGLVVQTQHTQEGHRGFFAGKRFQQGRWWYLPGTVILKTPSAWALGFLLAGGVLFFRRRRLEAWAPWIPLIVFGLLLVGANKISIGVRHALPVIAFCMLSVAVVTARIKRLPWRSVVAALLLGNAVVAVALSYPNYLAYFPVWAGGASEGHRYLVDSNHDWGQQLDVLEENWAAIIDANGGQPPHLFYFGFLDPHLMYDMPMSSTSLRGFMDAYPRTLMGAEAMDEWREALEGVKGIAVVGASALCQEMMGVNLDRVALGELQGKVGDSYFVYLVRP